MLYFSLILGLAPSNITFPEVRETQFRVTWNPLPQQFHIGRLLGYRIYFRRSAYSPIPLNTTVMFVRNKVFRNGVF